jgi:hypothetical protein
MKDKILPVGVIMCVCVLALTPLLIGPGILNTRAGGDSPFLLQRTFELAQNLRFGIFPARWMPIANFGLGYPFFNFYAALPYYLAALVNVMGVNIIFSIKFVQTLGFVLSAMGIWLLARRFLSVMGALVATVAYLLAPFHLANIYVRGDSLSEFWAFVWFPIILWGVFRGGTLGWWAITLALAALALTHNVSVMLFAPFFVICAFACLPISHKNKLKPIAKYALWLMSAGIVAMLLSAWFWLSALVESSLVQLGDQTTGYLNYAGHFRAANLVQRSFFYNYTVAENLDVFAMGLVQTLFVIGGLVLWIMRQQINRLLVPVLFGLATLLITPLSEPIWELVKPLQLAQFPWRALSVQSLFAALLIGKWGEVKKAWLIVIALLCASALPQLPTQRLWLNSNDVNPAALSAFEWFSGNIGTTIRAEYLPKTAQPKPITGPSILQKAPNAIAFAGEIGKQTHQVISPQLQRWQIEVLSAQADIALPHLFWQGWRINLGGKDLVLSPQPGSGWVKIQMPQGTHTFDLWLDKTPIQIRGEQLSLLGIIAMLAIGLWQVFSFVSTRQRVKLNSLTYSLLFKTPHFRLLSTLLSNFIGVLITAIAFSALIVWALGHLAPKTHLQGNLQPIDFSAHPYPHREPIRFYNPQNANEFYDLDTASISPSIVRAGDSFTLTLRWKNDLAPQRVTLTQETPSGLIHEPFNSRLIRNTRATDTLTQTVHPIITPINALAGPMLLKLQAFDASGNALSSQVISGDALDAVWLYGLKIEPQQPSAPFPAMRTFRNGLVLHTFEWQQTDESHVCFRPVWSANRPIADAYQVSIRLRDAQNRDIATVDAQPQLGLAPTWSWKLNQLVYDSFCNVPMRSKLNPNDPYSVQIIWYRVSDLGAVGEAGLIGTVPSTKNTWLTPK